MDLFFSVYFEQGHLFPFGVNINFLLILFQLHVQYLEGHRVMDLLFSIFFFLFSSILYLLFFG